MFSKDVICKKYWAGCRVKSIVEQAYNSQKASKKEALTKREVQRIVEETLVDEVNKVVRAERDGS